MREKLRAVQRRIVREVRRLFRKNEPLNISAVKRNHPELIRAAHEIKPFWGWKRALEAVTRQVWTARRRYPSPEAVIRGITPSS